MTTGSGSLARLTRRAMLAALLAAVAGSGLAEPLKLAANEGLAVQWVGEQVLREVYRRAGLEMQVEPLPPARASLMTANGTKDGEVARIGAYARQFPELVRVEPPYYAIVTTAYTRVGVTKTFATAEDLVPHTVAFIRGVTHAQRATQGHPAVTEVANAETLYRMLLHGRIEIALDTALNGGYMLDAPPYQGALKPSGAVATLELYHYLHPRHRALADRIGRAIKEMKASGELDKLIAAAEKDVRKRGLTD